MQQHWRQSQQQNRSTATSCQQTLHRNSLLSSNTIVVYCHDVNRLHSSDGEPADSNHKVIVDVPPAAAAAYSHLVSAIVSVFPICAGAALLIVANAQ